MTIGITGATGHLGRLVVDKLKNKVPAEQIVALVRSPAKASELGIAAREADYNRPETLDKALSGVDTLLLISSSELGRRVVQHRNVIEAAKKAGGRRIIYTSVLRADRSPLSVAAEHRETETWLKSSGISYTILRNGWYTENYAMAIPGALAGGVFLGSAGDGKISSASRVDFAEAAIAALTSEEHNGKTYELAGDEAYTLTDLAAEVSRQADKSIPFKNLPEAEYANALIGFGMPEDFARVVASWDALAAKGALYDDSHQLSALIGRPTTPLSVVVAEALTRVS